MKNQEQEIIQLIEDDANSFSAESPQALEDEVVDIAALMGDLETEQSQRRAAHLLIEVAGGPRWATEYIKSVKRSSQKAAQTIGKVEQTITEVAEEEYFAQPIVEILPKDITLATERLLKGENAAVIIRAGSYKDFDEEIMSPLKIAGKLQTRKIEQFPRHDAVNGSTKIHLDNFATDTGSTFPYTMSISRVDRGRVMFIGSLATPDQTTMTNDQYNGVQRIINNDRHFMKEIEDQLRQNRPRVPDFDQWVPKAPGGETAGVGMQAHMLSEGDIVIWPQGGEGAELPAWHGFYQVGNLNHPKTIARQTTSYHLVAQN